MYLHKSLDCSSLLAFKFESLPKKFHKYLLLLYLTRCCPFAAAAVAWLLVAEVLTEALPPGLAGRFVGALEGRPGWCAPPLLAAGCAAAVDTQRVAARTL